MKTLFGSLFAGLLVATTTWAAGTVNHYQYSVRVPATQAGCTAEAATLVKALTAVHSNLQNVKGLCSDQSSFVENGVTYALDTLVVNYDSAGSEILPAKTSLEMGSLGSFDDVTSVYASYAECLADISTQQANYTQATGLSTLAVSCEPTDSGPLAGYKLVLQSLGTSPVRLYQFQNNSFDSFTTDTAWQNLVATQLQAAGASLTKKVGESFFYYANQSVELKSETLVTTANANDCEAQRTQANAFLTAAGAKSITTVCHANATMDETLDIVADVYDYPTSDFGYGSLVYYSFQSCLNDLTREQAGLVAKGDSNSYLFCTSEDTAASGQYKIVVLKARDY